MKQLQRHLLVDQFMYAIYKHITANKDIRVQHLTLGGEWFTKNAREESPGSHHGGRRPSHTKEPYGGNLP